jgi:hypothetical protein
MNNRLVSKIQALFYNYYAIGVYQTGERCRFELLEFAYYKQELKVESKFSSLSFEEIVGALKKNLPILLHLEGDDVLSKEVDLKTNYRQDLIFKSNMDHFFFYERPKEKMVYASVIRKEIVEAYLSMISDKGNFVVHISFGPYVLANLSLIQKDDITVSSPLSTLRIIDGEISALFTSTNALSQEFSFQGDIYTASELPLLACFLDFKFRDSDIKEQIFIQKNKEEQKFKTRFLFFGVIALVCVLMLLISGHFILKQLEIQLSEKETSFIMAQRNLDQIKQLKDELSTKEKMLYSSGLNNHQYLTKYVAEIGDLLDGSSNLVSIEVFPIKKKVNTSEKVNFIMDAILVQGETQYDSDFNNWIMELKRLKWVRKVDITKYDNESKSVNKFELNIKL